jgi:hypothetical protein
MAALLIAEEEDQTQVLPSKQRNSNKARKHKNKRKGKPDEVDDTGLKGLEAIGGSVVALSSGGGRDDAGARDAIWERTFLLDRQSYFNNSSRVASTCHC